MSVEFVLKIVISMLKTSTALEINIPIRVKCRLGVILPSLPTL